MDWSRGHTIGHGSSATVSTATLRSSGEILAVKSAELSRSESLQRENKILSTLNHPNVVCYKGYDISQENNKAMFNLMMEYAPDGTLADAIRGPRLDESTMSRYARGIVTGLEYLHSRGIVHCDVKGSNVLLSKLGEAKIADFGCAKAADEAAVCGGTPMYMSPEVARGDEQGFSADIWAVGCTVIEMATGDPPWPNSTSTLRRIAFSGETPEVPGCLSDLVKDFLSKCLRVDSNERWTAGQLLRHPFLDESRLGHVRERTCSPTCVLDQGIIWSSCEMDYGDLLLDGGPMERMKELCVNSGKDNWEWGERWMIVRDGENVNISNFSGGEFRNFNLQRGTQEF